MQDGDAKLTKSITEVDKSQGIYRVNISTQGKNITTTHSEAAKLYVAIAFDVSSSMGKTSGTKFTNAKNGLKTFISQIRTNYSSAEFALVTYETGSDVISDFGDPQFDQKVDGLKSGADTGPWWGTSTYLGNGMEDAKNLLNNKKSQVSSIYPDAKYIMLVVGDGDAVVIQHKQIQQFLPE